MVDQIRKPGVNITQVIGGTPPTPVTATLVPCIVGPAFEVVELTGDDGTASVESQVQTAQGPLLYRQLPIHLDVSDYPAPRADANQMSVLVPEVQVALQRTGEFNILDRSPGTAFLKGANEATRPGIWISTAQLEQSRAATFIVLVDTDINNNAASFVVNNNAASVEDLLENITSTVTGTGYFAHTLDTVPGFVLHSTRYGATASISLVSVSGGATSNAFFDTANIVALQYGGNNITKIRCEGGGFYAEDNVNPTILTSPIVRFTPGKGVVVVDGNVSDTLDVGENSLIGGKAFVTVQVDMHGNVDASFPSGTFDFINDLPLRAATPRSMGDTFTAGGPIGQSISRVMVTEVQNDYIKLGVVNSSRSIFDAEGNPTRLVFSDFQLGTLKNPVPFAPKNAYFIAHSLTEFSPETPQGTALPATLEGDPVSASLATAPQVILTGWDETDANQVASTNTLAFQLALTINGVTETMRVPFINDDAAANIALWAGNVFDGKIVASYAGTTFTFESVVKGADVHLGLDDIDTGLTVDVEGDFGTDDEIVGLAGDTLTFFLNDGPTEYSFTAASTSIPLFVNMVNDKMGYEALTYSTDSAANEATFTLTSYLLGVASKVSPLTTSTGAVTLGLNGIPVVGSGRPNPDVWVRRDGSVVISGDIMRNTITGTPVAASTSARVHLAYRALRLDLTPSASAPGIIRVSSVDTLAEVFGPISPRNPFALAIYYALLNTGDGIEINAIGVDDVSEAEPDGTVLAYASAAEFLRSYEVYSIVPLTHNENVIALFDNHVKDMSAPDLRAERTVITAPANPTRHNDTVVLSTGESGAESTGIGNQVDLNDSPEAVLNSLGVDTSAEIPFQLGDLTQLYVHITIGDASYKYSVSHVSGGRVTIRTMYTSAQNSDGFYSTNALPSEFVNAEFSLALRGAPLTIASTGLLDKTAYAETVREAAQQYLNRRQIRLYPDTVQSDAIGGINQRIPSYYFAAALAGTVGNIDAQEPLTRVPMVGFNDSIGPALTRTQLNTISAGNAVIEPESEGSNPSLRMQGSTDPSTIESREWSVTRAVDAFSKTLRTQLKSRIGRFNITQAYIDELSMLVDSMCKASVDQGQFRGADVLKLEQDVTQPDTILVEIQLEVLYPANYINVTLVV
jgi:hypothetical protein